MIQLLAVAALVTGLAGSVRADDPRDGRELLALMRARGHIYQTLTFAQTTRRPGVADETWYESCQLPGRLRIDVVPLDSQRVIVFRNDTVFNSRLGQPVRRRPYFHSLLYLLGDVFVVPAESSAAKLAASHFDLAKLREDHWDGRNVWVVGAAAGDSAS